MTQAINSKPKTAVDELITRQVAGLVIAGCSQEAIAKELDITRHAVRVICETQKFKELMIEAGESALKTAIGRVRTQMARLSSKAIQVLETQLDDNNLEAAKTVFKIMGVEQQEEKVQDTVLNVILPGAKTEQVIEVTNGIRETS